MVRNRKSLSWVEFLIRELRALYANFNITTRQIYHIPVNPRLPFLWIIFLPVLDVLYCCTAVLLILRNVTLVTFSAGNAVSHSKFQKDVTHVCLQQQLELQVFMPELGGHS